MGERKKKTWKAEETRSIYHGQSGFRVKLRDRRSQSRYVDSPRGKKKNYLSRREVGES